MQAARISFKSSNILLINTYFPTDPQRENQDESDLLETLGYVKKVVEQNACDGLLWAGDLNSDFSRNSSHTAAVQAVLHELGLHQGWDRFDIDYTAAHDMLGQTFTSTLDHFIWSPSLDQSVLDAGVLHLPDNKSDHSPIYCKISFSSIQQTFSVPKTSQAKPSWKRANLEQKSEYRDKLSARLSLVNLPNSVLQCRHVHCKDSQHLKDLDQYTIEVLETLQAVAEECLPTISSSFKPGKAATPGWHQLWISAGRPINTQLHLIMKRTRNTYHYHYKKCRKAEKLIRRNKLLSACVGGEGDLFKEVKALRQCPPVIATSIDGVTENIPGHFSDIYSTLYNSADDTVEFNLVHQQVQAAVNSSHLDRVLKITPELLKEATSKLKPGKSDPVYRFSSDCFKNADDSLFVHLSHILKCCVIHSHVSQVLLLTTLVPLVKDKLGNINTSKNYRSVAISSILL